MVLHSETKTLSSSYAEVKDLVRMLVDDLDKNDLIALAGFLDVLEKTIVVEENIFILVDGTTPAHEHLLATKTPTSTDKEHVDISIGFNRLKQIYEKIRAATASSKDVNFVFKDYIHGVVKQALRRIRKKYSSGDKSEINLSCVSNINDDLIVMYLAWDWKSFLKAICAEKLE